MIQDQVLRVLLTVLFGGSGLFLMAEVIQCPLLRGRIDAGTHVLMCAAMIAMAWPWGVSWPVPPQVIIFSLAALWFLAQLWLSGPASPLHAHGHGALRVVALIYHAVMMLATVWMVTAMPTLMTTSPSAGGGTTSVMDMSGTHVASTNPPVPQGSTGELSHGFAVASGRTFLAIFAVASAFLMFTLVREVSFRLTTPTTAAGPEPAVTDPLGGSTLRVDQRTRSAYLPVVLSETAMSVGMVAMLLVMLG